jgi:WS/DGAT/MGAT family acyltransferase
MCPEISNSEPFSPVDAAWLQMDTPTNMAMITGVLMFEEPIDMDRLKAVIEYRLLRYDRFRQRVKQVPGPFRRLRWELDPYFDLYSHVQRIGLPAPGDDAALKEFVGNMMSVPLDPTKPLWHICYVENYKNGCALVVRLHHCIADGIALVQVLLSLTDAEANAPLPEIREELDRQSTLLGKMLLPPLTIAAKSLNLTGRMLRETLDTLDRPSRLIDFARLGVDGGMALGKLILIGADQETVLRGKCGVLKKAAWSQPVNLDEIKTIGRAYNATVNDVLIAAVTGGLRRYLESKEQPVDALNIRAIVPYSIRSFEELASLGNQFGLVFLDLPVGVLDLERRLRVIKLRMDRIKNTPEATVAFGILQATGMTSTQIESIIVNIFSKKATAVMTNVPGPKSPIYLAGKELSGMMFWVPQPGGLALGVSILSYAGEILLGIASDAGLIPDPDAIISGFHQEIELMKTLVS